VTEFEDSARIAAAESQLLRASNKMEVKPLQSNSPQKNNTSQAGQLNAKTSEE